MLPGMKLMKSPCLTVHDEGETCIPENKTNSRSYGVQSGIFVGAGNQCVTYSNHHRSSL